MRKNASILMPNTITLSTETKAFRLTQAFNEHTTTEGTISAS